jgi:hypothetical protein
MFLKGGGEWSAYSFFEQPIVGAGSNFEQPIVGANTTVAAAATES